MAELYIVKNDLTPSPSIAERVGSEEREAVFTWLDKELGGRAVAIWAGEIVGIDEETQTTGQVLDHSGGSVAGVFTDIRQVVVRSPRAADKSSLGIFDVMDVAVFSTSNGPADISDEMRERMENNDTTVASLFGEVGVPFTQEVAFKSLRDNSRTEEEEERAASPPKLRVIR
ncbi:MAG TPA: hypothetical protein VFZ62_03235 [Candidatus Saccharimonadales bacterium]